MLVRSNWVDQWSEKQNLVLGVDWQISGSNVNRSISNLIMTCKSVHSGWYFPVLSYVYEFN